MSRRFAPWRGVESPPGQELLGVITSHGPSRESYRSSRKSRGSAEAIAPSAADAALSAERVRGALRSPAGAPALLQRRVPGSGAGMVAMEKTAKQTLYSGLTFSHDGKHVYASMASLTDPVGTGKGDTGSGVAVY